MTSSIRITAFIAAIGMCSLTACGAGGDASEDPSDTLELSNAAMIESGREIVKVQCATCHAIGKDDQSPRLDAPPLRIVLANYAPEALAADFREHIHVGHPDMPDFDFGPLGTDHVLAYLKSIQSAPERDE